MDWGKVVPYHNPFRMREVPLFLTREVPLFLMRKVPLFLMREVPLYANICAVTDGGLTAMDWGKVLPKEQLMAFQKCAAVPRRAHI